MPTTEPQLQMLPILRAISLEAPSCTLLTTDLGKVEVQAHLLSTLSPFLASLLAQAGPSSPVISLPFSENLVRGLFSCLVQNEPLSCETLEIATILGIQGGPKLNFTNQERRETKKHVIKENPSDFQELDIKDGLKKNSNGFQSDNVSLKEEDEPENIVQAQISEPVVKYVKDKRTPKAHKKVHKEELKPHICNLCGKTFSSKQNLGLHLKRHDKREEVACNQCSKICSSTYKLNKHIKTHAPKSEPQKEKVKSLCNICSKWLATRHQLRAHTRLLHGENKHLPCSNCGKNFKVSCVGRHEKLCKLSEEEKTAIKVECDECGKILANKGKLKRHIRFVHNNEKLFKCKLCDHEDYRNDNMKTHIKSSHPGEDPNKLYCSIGGVQDENL